MAETPVVDASPLIHLSRARQLDLLKILGSSVAVPATVIAEIRAKRSDETAQVVEQLDWLIPVPDPQIPSPIRRLELGAGESAVLAWALSHPGSTAILDDFEGRRCAQALQIPSIGTLGIVLSAKRMGRVIYARPIVESLIAQGMYLSASLRDKALALVGE